MICPSKLHFESVGWIGYFFFKSSNGFKVREINLYQEREGMFFIYSYTVPCEFIWQVCWGGAGGGRCCVGGRKINPPIPTILTSLYISNLYMNPIIFNYPFSLLLPPFWFFLHICLFYFSPITQLGGFFFLALVASC
jgi:hypothetical protein